MTELFVTNSNACLVFVMDNVIWGSESGFVSDDDIETIKDLFVRWGDDHAGFYNMITDDDSIGITLEFDCYSLTDTQAIGFDDFAKSHNGECDFMDLVFKKVAKIAVKCVSENDHDDNGFDKFVDIELVERDNNV